VKEECKNCVRNNTGLRGDPTPKDQNKSISSINRTLEKSFIYSFYTVKFLSS